MQKIHVVFNPSAAGSLRLAFLTANVEEEVIAFFDDLSYGPIAPPEQAIRIAWIREHLNYDADWVKDFDEFWRVALNPSVQPILWLDRHSASEFSGFLEFLFRMGGRECFVVDLTEASELNGYSSSGGFTYAQILKLDLAARATQLTNEQRLKCLADWRSAKNENAPLRTVDSTFNLIASNLSHFDAAIMANITGDWKKSTRIVGETLSALSYDVRRSVNELLIWARLRNMIESNLIKSKGNETLMYESFVRLHATL